MPSYYTYGDYNPSALNQPNTGYWEDTRNWPRSYQYAQAYDYYQGLHPPAPVYQSNQPAQAPMYYYGQNSGATPQGYYASNGQYYAVPQATASGWPYNSSYTCSPLSKSQSPSYTCYPLSTPQSSYSNFYYPCSTAPSYFDYAASAQALAANAALAQMPNTPFMYVGKTQAEIDMQNAIIAAAYANAGIAQPAPSMPTQLAPYKPTNGQQFWCKETDGSWTLREQKEVIAGDLSPGHWEKHATSGYFYWVRHSG